MNNIAHFTSEISKVEQEIGALETRRIELLGLIKDELLRAQDLKIGDTLEYFTQQGRKQRMRLTGVALTHYKPYSIYSYIGRTLKQNGTEGRSRACILSGGYPFQKVS